ncbi:hypothetical protein EV193_10999 [Herbihabitans rhizosphaerae]|uniref:Uncharacterized protein n=1 Tax=Herbihabitans rhizosphaerae TaxID=1872711 RepID=A0A4Q7KGD5_9PSEU|nr:hypothetical protein [Herbihabitans rhizosphaerae]RZS34312.1 hypothetical protein EV193_10999 [Herbihabitans rhizosphaerae]
MPTISEDARQLLRYNLYEHLDEAEFLATKTADWTDDDADTARDLIPDLINVIRGVLVEHSTPAASTCPACRVPWPCPTLSTVHRLIKDPDNKLVTIRARAVEQRLSA